MTILAVCKDTGGMQGLLPVVRLLRKNHDVALIAGGVAYGVLQKMGEDCLKYDHIKDVLADYPRPDILLTSMDSHGGMGRDLVPVLRTVCPIVAIQNYWGENLADAWHDPVYRPNFITVNDEFGSKLVRKFWPEYRPDRIKITGFPAFDELAGIDVESVSRRMKESLNIDKSMPVIFFVGQGDYTGHALSELIAAIDYIGKDVCLIARPHPRMKTDFSFEIPGWERAVASFKRGLILENCSDVSIFDLLCVSDVSVCMYSTVLIHAAALGKQNISILYSEAGMLMFLKEFQGSVDEYPLIALNCTTRVGDREELIKALDSAYRNSLGQQEAQKASFRLDGGNSRRVADLVESLL